MRETTCGCESPYTHTHPHILLGTMHQHLQNSSQSLWTGANLLGLLLNLTVEQPGREDVVIDAFRFLSVQLRICPGEFCQLDTSYIQLG